MSYTKVTKLKSGQQAALQFPIPSLEKIQSVAEFSATFFCIIPIIHFLPKRSIDRK
ncbi:MAG: hypothetical protein VB108_08185 [Anaerolineaceae bacterium]|nr:hypothetical protein [Anaerolineaceae bacterium]